MQVIKKINNNVAFCIDGAGRQVIAIGKGIGFGAIPRTVPLAEIERTFYDIDDSYAELFRTLSPDLLQQCIRFVERAQQVLPYAISSSAALTMADHIGFAIQRAKKNIHVELPLSFEMQHQCPLEMELAEGFRRSLKQIKINLPKNETVGIAMNLVNAQVSQQGGRDRVGTQGFEQLLRLITHTVEERLDIEIDRTTFNFARFATHIYYLSQRLSRKQAIGSENLSMYEKMCDAFPTLRDCVEEIAAKVQAQPGGGTLSEEEKFYLMLHINRIIERQDEESAL